MFDQIKASIGPRDDKGQGLDFVNNIRGGSITASFIEAVKKGFEIAMKNGVLAGFPVESMRVELNDGQMHDVDSSELAFQLVAENFFRTYALKANPVIIEPIMAVEVTCPEENIGTVTGDLTKRRGIINDVEARVWGHVVKASVPLSELFGYVTDLRTVTQGRATTSMTLLEYDEVPKNIQEGIIGKIKGKA